MKPRSTIIIAVAALLVGGAIGHFVPPLFTRAPEPAAEEVAVKAPERRPAHARMQQSHERDATLNRLRTRIKSLERQLADATQKAAEPEEETSVKAEERPRNPFLRDGPPRPPTAAEMRANMEELREKDPERYAHMTNRFARIQEHRLQRVNKRLEILASVDTSRFNEKELQTHEALQDAIVKREELRQMINPQNEDVTEEQRWAMIDELRQLDETTRQLEKSERNALLNKTARSYGVSAANAREMTETIKAIYDATGSDGHHGPPGGGPGGPRGGGWGRR